MRSDLNLRSITNFPISAYYEPSIFVFLVSMRVLCLRKTSNTLYKTFILQWWFFLNYWIETKLKGLLWETENRPEISCLYTFKLQMYVKIITW